MSTQDAMARAEEQNLELVEVNQKAQPPVCKILDYGKFKYETADGVGLMLSLPVQGEKPATRARHEIQVAPGVDIVLSLCVMYAHKLASDELVKAPAAPV